MLQNETTGLSTRNRTPDANLVSTHDVIHQVMAQHDEDEQVPGQPVASYNAFIARLHAAELPSTAEGSRAAAEDGRRLASPLEPPLKRPPDWSTVDVTARSLVHFERPSVTDVAPHSHIFIQTHT